MPARMCLLCNALIHRYSSPHDLYKVTLAGGLRMMINFRSDKMAVPVAAAVDMPVAAARSFLFSARESVVGNLLNSSVQDWSCFLPSVRPSVLSRVRTSDGTSLSMLAAAAFGVVYRLRLAPHATAAAPPPLPPTWRRQQRRRHHRACRVYLCVCIKKKPLSFQQS